MIDWMEFFPMKQITRDAVFEKKTLTPRKRCFAQHTGLQMQKQNGSKSFSVKFSESVKPIFEEQTRLELFYNRDYNNYYRMINSEKELRAIKEWEAQQGNRVFIRDCLSLSMALDFNYVFEPSGQQKKRTWLGLLEYEGKWKKNEHAITQLANITAETIKDLPFYREADFICSVPSNSQFNFPGSVTNLVSEQIQKQDITSGFVFGNQKQSIKNAPHEEKWDTWEAAQLTFQNSQKYDIKGKSIILIDDKYQSGITSQYVAMKLQQAGVSHIYGLCFVKTLRDTDNQ